MRDACLLLFTKPAAVGKVKTRLIAGAGEGVGAGLTPEQAAELHQAFLDDLSARLATGSFDLTLAWALEADQEKPESPHPWIRQAGHDLGARLFGALSDAARSYRVVGAVGSDHPELPLAVVESGFARLREGVEVVLGPASDGGYYFVGARAGSVRSEMFEGIEWSTPSVLEATLKRCRDLSLCVELLESGSDVDTPDDLARLAHRLEHASPGAMGDSVQCPRTTGLLRDWGLIAVSERVTT